MRGLPFIINIVTLAPAFVLAWMAFTSAMKAAQLGGWRPTWSSPSSWFGPPTGVDAAGWRQWRRCALCLWGATACLQLGTFLLPFAMQAQ